MIWKNTHLPIQVTAEKSLQSKNHEVNYEVKGTTCTVQKQIWERLQKHF